MKYVNVVEYRDRVYGTGSPQYNQYAHEDITRITPCIKQDNGKLIDLRTGEEFKPKQKNVSEWSVHPGTLLKYPDGTKLLLTRKMTPDREVIVLPVEDDDYRPSSVVTVKVGERK